ncbi:MULTISPECIES: hemolysin family protein [unclassified Jeotgalibaca]|uniref:hemolysin family protein n=1 Tax=unclassified Jeotgalibaca TaxID=2621505 RepID=UPI003FD09031
MNADPDSQNLVWQLLLVALLTWVNAFFASAEMAFVSLNKNKVATEAIKGDEDARKVLALLDNSDDFLATIQVAITLAGFLSSASAANSFANVLEPYLTFLPGAKQLAVLIVTILLSYISLVFGELFPKQVAMQNSEEIAYRGAGVITIVQKFMKPFVRLLSFSTSLLEKITPLDFSDNTENYSREEVQSLLKQSSSEGTIEADEFNMLKGVLAMDNKLAREVMVPRTDTFMLDITDDTYENIQIALDSPYTRIPVYNDDKDEVIGLLHLKNLLKESRRTPLEKIDLRKILNRPLFVPETITTDQLMAVLKRSHNQLAILHDEYGGMVGIVTLEDILEEIVGDIEDEYDETYVLIERKSDNYFEVDGATPLYRFNDFFHTELESTFVDTIAGYLLTEVGMLPENGESLNIEVNGMEISTLEFENNRLAKVGVRYIDGSHHETPERLVVEEIPKKTNKLKE